jgi:hypothetical protein
LICATEEITFKLVGKSHCRMLVIKSKVFRVTRHLHIFIRSKLLTEMAVRKFQSSKSIVTQHRHMDMYRG